MHLFLEFGIFSSSFNPTVTSLSEEKLSISKVEMMGARQAPAWLVHTFGFTSPSMTHQPIEESGNGDFSFRPPTSNLSLERWVNTRVVGWDGADVAD